MRIDLMIAMAVIGICTFTMMGCEPLEDSEELIEDPWPVRPVQKTPEITLRAEPEEIQEIPEAKEVQEPEQSIEPPPKVELEVSPAPISPLPAGGGEAIEDEALPPAPPIDGSVEHWDADDGEDQGDDEGDDEEEDDDDMPDGFCKNGHQEVLPQPKHSCPGLLYGAAQTANGSDLVLIDPNSGVARIIGAIVDANNLSRNFGHVVMDFSPDGLLYGLGTDPLEANTQYHFLQIDCKTGHAQDLNATGFYFDLNFSFSDMDIDAQGRAFVYDQDRQNLDRITLLTGDISVIGNASNLTNPGPGNGLASIGFPESNNLHLASGDFYYEINKNTAQVSIEAGLTWPPEFFGGNTANQINSIDQDFFTERTFGSAVDTHGQNYLVRVHLGGEVDVIGATSLGLSALAFFRLYEECDNASPPGTLCDATCHIRENICDDCIDNDQNGLTDCDDPACAKSPNCIKKENGNPEELCLNRADN